MSVKNSNILGVYVQNDSIMTTPITDSIVGSDADYTAHSYTGVTDGDYVYLHGGKATFLNVTSEVATELNLELAGCATNTTLDISNAINETVCRDGLGASTRHIVSGATTWTIQVDGLFGNPDADDTAFDLIGLANANAYVIVKFSTDVTGTSTDYIGQALLESVNISGGVDDIATYSVSLSGQGLLYTAL